MPRRSAAGTTPTWDLLYETAAGQAGYITAKQAATAGYSHQLLRHYLQTKRLERAGRGVLRIVHFPANDHEDLVVLWLWSEREGVFSHETALVLHDLSDALPRKRHMTLPLTWSKRRLRVPSELVLHFAAVARNDRSWVGAIPVTSPRRTVLDCAAAHVSPELVQQAVRQGARRGLFEKNEITRAMKVRDAAEKLRDT